MFLTRSISKKNANTQKHHWQAQSLAHCLQLTINTQRSNPLNVERLQSSPLLPSPIRNQSQKEGKKGRGHIR